MQQQPQSFQHIGSVLLLFAGIGLGYYGQRMLIERSDLGYAFYVLGLVCWLVALVGLGPRIITQDETKRRTLDFSQMPTFWVRVMQIGATILAIVLALSTYRMALDLRFHGALLVRWSIALGLVWLVALPPRFCLRLPSSLCFDNIWQATLLAAGLLVAGYALFVNLETLPRDMISDHVENIQDVYRVLDGDYDIYFGNSSGREPFYFYLVALVSGFTPPTYIDLKVTSAAIAFLTLPFIYGLGAAMGNRWVGTFAVVIAATSGWHLALGRLGFRAPLASFSMAMLLFFLYRALHDNRRSDYLRAGVALGFGMHGYASFRIVPLLVVVAFGLALMQHPRRRWLQIIINGFWMGIISLIIYLPLAAFWRVAPDIYWTRTRAFADEPLGIGDYLEGFWQTVSMLHVTTDPVVMNIAAEGAPVLTSLEGALVLLGGLSWLWWVAQRREPLLMLLPVAFVVALLPSALGVARPNEMPSARRAIMAFPIVMIFGGMALSVLATGIQKGLLPNARRAGMVWVLALLLVNAWHGAGLYFEEYSRGKAIRPERHVAGLVSNFIAHGGDAENAYIMYGFGWLDTRAVSIWLKRPDWDDDQVITELTPQTCTEQLPADQLFIAILSPSDVNLLEALKTCFPLHYIQAFNYPDGTVLWQFGVPSEAITQTE